jgi:hypothetical protein
MKLESRHDAASSMVEAAKCYMKCDQQRECHAAWRPRGTMPPTPHERAALMQPAMGAGPTVAWTASRSPMRSCNDAAPRPLIEAAMRRCAHAPPTIALQARSSACSKPCRCTPTWGGWAWPLGSSRYVSARMRTYVRVSMHAGPPKPCCHSVVPSRSGAAHPASNSRPSRLAVTWL